MPKASTNVTHKRIFSHASKMDIDSFKMLDILGTNKHVFSKPFFQDINRHIC